MSKVADSTASWPGLSLLTAQRLEIFVALLLKWNPVINLVSRNSVEAIRFRHVADSIQVFEVAPKSARVWVDLGSGAGFPGLVVALLAAEAAPQLSVTLVESDQRKAAFLRNVSRETGVGLTVLANRIESLPPLQADVLSARALAPLSRLCQYAARHLAEDGMAIFPKGAQALAEVDEARRDWDFDLERLPSVTEPGSSLLILKGVTHV